MAQRKERRKNWQGNWKAEMSLPLLRLCEACASWAFRLRCVFTVSHRKGQSEGGQLTVERLLLDGNTGMCYNELYRGELQTPKVTYFSRKKATIVCQEFIKIPSKTQKTQKKRKSP
jgi:hypothetical protein